MILFKTIKYKNILSTGNIFNTIDLTATKTNLLIGVNASGKCVYINTPIRVRNSKTGDIFQTTIGEFYESQKKQNKGREDN
jgi:hypothetical protein